MINEINCYVRCICTCTCVDVQVLVNPFDDIVPRVVEKAQDDEAGSRTKPKSEAKATK